jgi:hypothetical protein
VRAESAADLAAGEELGITVHRITPDQRDQWRQVTASVTDQLVGTIGGQSAEIYAVIQKARKEFVDVRQAFR